MAKKWTKEEANRLVTSVGGMLIGKYINGTTNTEFQCPKCNTIFTRTFARVYNHKQIFCIKCAYKNGRTSFKYTKEEFLNAVKQIGGKYVSGYCGKKNNCSFECVNCKQTYEQSPYYYLKTQTLKCDPCSKKQSAQKRKLDINHIKQIIKDRGFEWTGPEEEYNNSRSILTLKCKCGKEYKTSFQVIKYSKPNCGHRGTCGHCNDLYNGDRFGRLVIIETQEKPRRLHKCKCDCGELTGWLQPTNLRTGNSKSCGKCGTRWLNKDRTKWKKRSWEDCDRQYTECPMPNIGDRFGKLIIIETKSRRVKCKCECGNITKWYQAAKIVRGNTTSCGQCGLTRNSVRTSNIALKLQTITDKILGKAGQHNAQIPYVGNVDIYYPEERIIIEYCGFAFHRIIYGDKTKQDERKYKKILKENYKLLVINAAGNKNDLPTEALLRKILTNDFKHGVKRKTIIHKSWKIAEKKHQQREQKRIDQGGGSLDNKWTRKEDEYLLAHYHNMSTQQIAQTLAKTDKAITSRWKKIRPINTINKTCYTVDQLIERSNNSVNDNGQGCIYISGLITKKDGSANMLSKCQFRCCCGKLFTRTIKEVFYQKQTTCLKCAKRVSFSKEHQQYILDNYMTMDTNVLATQLGHTKGSIQTWWNINKPQNTPKKTYIDEQTMIKRISIVEKNGHKPIYISGYTTMNTKTGCWWQCPVCNDKFERSPDNIISKYNKDVVCLKCTHRLAGIRSGIAKKNKKNANSTL